MKRVMTIDQKTFSQKVIEYTNGAWPRLMLPPALDWDKSATSFSRQGGILILDNLKTLSLGKIVNSIMKNLLGLFIVFIYKST